MLQRTFLIRYAVSPNLSAQSIKVRDCLKKRERESKDMERKSEKKANRRNWIPLMAARGRGLGYLKVYGIRIRRAKSQLPLKFRWIILPGLLSRSVDSSMSNRCSFTAPFVRIFSSRCFNRIRFLIFQFQSSFGGESRFSLF